MANNTVHNGTPDKTANFRVLISGGGIAGLTLALALQEAGVDYLLLEARSDIAPQLGASIGLGPNGSRILDQLGCYDEIMALTNPIKYTGSHSGETGNYLRPKTDAFRLVQERANYCMCFLDRQDVLRILFEHIADKTRVTLGKKIVSVDQHHHGVTVTCQDDTCYSGDMIVGADGNYSSVRREMWRVADVQDPGHIPESEKQRMSAEYKCVFGISAPVPGLIAGAFDVTYKKDVSPIIITSRSDCVYWFLIARMDRVYQAGGIPRFTQEDARELVEAHADIPLMPGAQVTMRDVWERRRTCSMVALEEAYHEYWTWGRFALVGDSVHKMTPNMGSGGNSAIESAAALANSVVKMLRRRDNQENGNATPSLLDIQVALGQYQDMRRVRASRTVTASNMVTRLHAMKNRLYRFAALQLLPRAGDLLVDLASENWIGSVRLDYLPVPTRSLGGTMPFNPKQGMGKNESLLVRAVHALPLLAPLVYRCFITSQSQSQPASMTGSFCASFLADIQVRALTPQSLKIVDFGVLYAVTLVEAARRATIMTPLAVPVIFGTMSRLICPEIAMPVYYFVYTSLMPISRFKASDLRLTDMSYTRSVLPLTLGGYYLPYIALKLGAQGLVKDYAASVLYFSPLLVSVGQWICSKTIFPSTVQQDRLTNPIADLRTIRYSIGILASLSSMSWLSRPSLRVALLDDLFRQFAIDDRWALGRIVNDLLQSGHAMLSYSSLLWTVYQYWDLKGAGMVRKPWSILLLALGASTLVLGPGATVALAWLYREELLAKRRHKDAIVSE